MGDANHRQTVSIVPELVAIVFLACASLTPLILSSGVGEGGPLIGRHWPVWSLFHFEPLVGLDAWLHWLARLLIGVGVVNAVVRRIRPGIEYRRRMADGPVCEPMAGTVLHGLASRYGCVERLRVLPAQNGPVAFTAGFWNPRIYVSRALLEALDSCQLELVLLHELEHCRMRDPARSFFTTLLADLFFWLPVVGTLEERVMAKIEFGADDAAAVLDPTGLAQTILKVAELRVPIVEPAVVSFSRSDHLAARVRRLIRGDNPPIDDPARTRVLVRSTTAVLAALWILGITAYATHLTHEVDGSAPVVAVASAS